MTKDRKIPDYYFTKDWHNLRHKVLKRDNYICQYCGAHPSYQADHVIPRSKGGADHAINLKCCCQSCNRLAGGRLFANFEAKKKYIMGYKRKAREKRKKRKWAAIFGDWRS